MKTRKYTNMSTSKTQKHEVHDHILNIHVQNSNIQISITALSPTYEVAS